MVNVERRILELFDGKESVFFPQIKTIEGTWVSVTDHETHQQLAFPTREVCNSFLSKMPKQAYAIHEYKEPDANISVVGEA